MVKGKVKKISKICIEIDPKFEVEFKPKPKPKMICDFEGCLIDITDIHKKDKRVRYCKVHSAVLRHIKHPERDRTAVGEYFQLGKKGQVRECKGHSGYTKGTFSYYKHTLWLQLKEIINEPPEVTEERESKKHRISQLHTKYKKMYNDLENWTPDYKKKVRVIDTCMKMISKTSELLGFTEFVGEEIVSIVVEKDKEVPEDFFDDDGETHTNGYDEKNIYKDRPDIDNNQEKKGTKANKKSDKKGKYKGYSGADGYYHATGRLIGEDGLWLKSGDQYRLWVIKLLENWHNIKEPIIPHQKEINKIVESEIIRRTLGNKEYIKNKYKGWKYGKDKHKR